MAPLRAVVACLVLAVALVAQPAAAACEEDSYYIVGGGSNAIRRFVSDAMSNATQDANLKGLSLPFYTVGSGDGQKGWINSTYDFTIADFPLTSKLYAQATAGRQVVQFPIAIGGVNIIYNVKLVNDSKWSLNFTAEVAAGIFTGAIKTWDDPAILAINPNLTAVKDKIPVGQPITVVGRSDSSAANLVFSTWLAGAAPELWTTAPNSTLKWPSTFLSVTKGSGVTYGVGNASWSIAFLDAYAARQAYLPSAALENRARRTTFPKLKFVKYNVSADPLAAVTPGSVPIPAPDADWGNFTLVDMDGNATYPLLSVAMAATARDLTGKGERGTAQKQVFGYLLGPLVQASTRRYQEAPLPAPLQPVALEAVNSILTAGSKQFYLSTELPGPSGGYPGSFVA